MAPSAWNNNNISDRFVRSKVPSCTELCVVSFSSSSMHYDVQVARHIKVITGILLQLQSASVGDQQQQSIDCL